MDIKLYMLILVAAMQLIDAATTYILLEKRTGFHEVNPILAKFLGKYGVTEALILKLIVAGVAIYGFYSAMDHNLFVVGIVIFVLVYSYIIKNNLSLIKKSAP